MTEPDADMDVLTLVLRALGAAQESPGALVVPTVLLKRELLEERSASERGAQLANVVANWFRKHGFCAERSHFGGHGYGEIIKEVRGWYGATTATLRSQHQLEVEKRAKDRADLKLPPEAPEIRSFGNSLFEEQLLLREILTEEQCNAIYSAIFDSYTDEEGTWEDDFIERPGSPDLLVWHSDPARRLWFFCEIKSGNDHLREAQYAWLWEYWHQIEENFLLLLLDA